MAVGDPTRSAVIGRPSADRPTGSLAAATAVAGADSARAITVSATVTGQKLVNANFRLRSLARPHPGDLGSLG